jgi:hypothetical protein
VSRLWSPDAQFPSLLDHLRGKPGAPMSGRLRGRRWFCDQYGDTVYFYTDRARLAVDAHEKIDQAIVYGCTMVIDKPNGGAIYLMGIYDAKASTLVHECAHLALFIAQRRGLDLDGNGEAFAYLLDSIFRAACKRGVLNRRTHSKGKP